VINPEDEFLQRLRATFMVEADEHVQAMLSGVLELEKTPPSQIKIEAIETIFRHAHSLKGAARATNAADVETICQALETVLAEWKRQRIQLAAHDFDTLHRAIDLIGKRVPAGADAASREEGQSLSALLRQLAAMAAGDAVSEVRIPAGKGEPFSATAAVVSTEPIQDAEGSSPQKTSLRSVRGLTDTIRISTAKLDRLLLSAEEMLTVKQNSAQRAADLRPFDALFGQWTARWTRIQPQLRELRRGGEISESSSAALVEFLEWNFDHLKSIENRLRALTKATAQDQSDAAKIVDDLLAESKQLVMLPFSTLADFFPKLVRDLSRDQGKEVALVIRGADVEIDKRILEEMKDPLIHLVRNGIDHGVETPERRALQAKARQATLTLTAASIDGNKVEIVFSDDGGGIDLDRVKQSAVKRGILTAAEAAALEQEKALELIFQSDISTSPIITEISGRGLGLAIVREKTEKLGGRVTVETHPMAGTAFRITLPVMLATFRGILIKASGATFVVPTAQVERVVRVKTSDIKTVENRETISLAGRVLSLVRLDEVLELPAHGGTRTNLEQLSVILIGFGEQQIAFGVDEVLHDEEVLVKTLRRPLSRVRNIAGATVLASGRLAMILNSADLLKSARKIGGSPRKATSGEAVSHEPKNKSILMAEDSITSRMLLKGILESAGYRVKTAVDGLDAWTTLRTEHFDLIVSDVEMPRMNGFDLTANIRADKKLADLPVVLVTALASSADRERGIDVGANAYIVKSSFDQTNLLDVIRRLA
jgi:two-component system chemotaxis sensor kinase CheA